MPFYSRSDGPLCRLGFCIYDENDSNIIACSDLRFDLCGRPCERTFHLVHDIRRHTIPRLGMTISTFSLLIDNLTCSLNEAVAA